MSRKPEWSFNFATRESARAGIEGPFYELHGEVLFPESVELLASPADPTRFPYVRLRLEIDGGRPVCTMLAFERGTDGGSVEQSMLKDLEIANLINAAVIWQTTSARAIVQISQGAMSVFRWDDVHDTEHNTLALRRQRSLTEELIKEVAEIYLGDTSGKPTEAVAQWRECPSKRTAIHWVGLARKTRIDPPLRTEVLTMASIDKQPNGRWRARYRDLNGRSRSSTFDRKIDAKQFLDDCSTDQRRGEWIDPRSRRDTFDHWADRWWATTVKLRPTTRRGYHGILERHVRPYFTGRKVVEVDYMDVEEFIADRLSAGLSPKYVRQAVSVLSLVMQSAQRGNVRRDNPAAGHKVTVRRKKIRTGDVLSMEQVHRLVAEVKDPYKPAVWLIAMAGLRPAELCGIRVGNVDFIGGSVHVAETVLPVHKFADEKYAGAVSGPPKTDAGDRRVPIPQWLCVELAALVAQRAERRGTPTRPDEYLFQTRYGSPINRDKFREKVVRPALKRAGLPDSIRTYDLRHTHASLLIDLGAKRPRRRTTDGPLRPERHTPGVRAPVRWHPRSTQRAARRAAANRAQALPPMRRLYPCADSPDRTRAGHTRHAKDTKSWSIEVSPGQQR